METLLNRIGGQENLKRLVKRLYIDVLNNDELFPYFAESLKSPLGIIEMEQKQTKFFKSVLSTRGKEQDMYEHPLVQKNLREEHFDLVLEYLKSGMAKLEIPRDVQGEVLSAIKKRRSLTWAALLFFLKVQKF